MQDFEKLGAFYLGKFYDLASRSRKDELLLYDSRDLVTHAVCVGMTGSGKTGLCLGLIEEAAIDGIPSIIIDPKGDLSNLMLTFPNLAAADFLPWINSDDAAKQGQSSEEFAAAQALQWRKGVAEWGQDGNRIQRFRDSAQIDIYTPGSSAGLQVSVLRSFDVPPAAIRDDSELFSDRIGGTATSLLGLLGIEAESSLQSREHILLSNILREAWSRGANLDIPTLIHNIQEPPFQKLGVMELESVYPAKDRFSLAMLLNNLVASPAFAAWMEGQPIDIQRMLYTPQGTPRIAIFSIAHLDDSQRMFFVSMLLNQVLAWTRTQSGTGSLRALVYMDEIAGYFPPVANPPSKRPLLTLMKQGRAFGVGCVLATQNPIDIDYKGLSNAGTWFIGRLQTERDKARVLDGLEGAAASANAIFNRGDADKALSALGSRVFLMNNVHEDHPVIFETRWCLSYLRGPLMRSQIKMLMDTRKAVVAAKRETTGAGSKPDRSDSVQPDCARSSQTGKAAARPVLPPDIPQYFLRARPGAVAMYEPRLLGLAKVYYADPKNGIEQTVAVSYLAPIAQGAVSVDWDHAEDSTLSDDELEKDPAQQATFATLPAEISKPRAFDAWRKQFADAIYRRHSLDIRHCPALDLVSSPGESERDFRSRLMQRARELRDQTTDRLRTKYAPRFTTLQDRIRRAEQNVAVQSEQASAAKTSSLLSVGSAILGAFLGRKVISSGNVGRAATAARGISRQSKEASDVARAEENVAALREQLADLERQFQNEIDEAAGQFNASAQVLETIYLKPKKMNITVTALVLAWIPTG